MDKLRLKFGAVLQVGEGKEEKTMLTKQKKQDTIKRSRSVEKAGQPSKEAVRELSREDKEAAKEGVTEQVSEMKRRTENSESANLSSGPGMPLVRKRRNLHHFVVVHLESWLWNNHSMDTVS